MPVSPLLPVVRPGPRRVNRYRIKGTLTCRSPLHIGCGEGTDQVDALVQTDCHGRPVVPGSALRGVVRHHLLAAAEKNQALRKSVLVLLGTAGDELGEDGAVSGKVRVDDAPRGEIASDPILPPEAAPHWDPARGTYRITSVCIHPETGAAEEKLLYNMEVVPQGTRFGVSITAWNLVDAEVGLLLTALDAFNDESGVLTLGAHAGRGFGRVRWCVEEVRMLGVRTADGSYDEDEWRQACKRQLGVGKELAALEQRAGDLVGEELLAQLRSAWTNLAPAPGTTGYDISLPLSLTLESGLVIRAGGGKDGKDGGRPAVLAYRMSAGEGKRRGERFALSEPATGSQTGVEVASPAWHVVIDDSGNPNLEFQIAGSGLRGTARSYLGRALGNGAASHIDSLFGTTEERGRLEIENAVPDTKARLQWRYEDHQTDGNTSGPAMRVHERGPVDRITGGAKSGGLHHFAAVEEGEKFGGRVLVRAASAKDVALLRLWRTALEEGQLALGGIGAAGYGLVRVAFGTPRVLLSGTTQQRALEQIEPADLRAEIQGIGDGCGQLSAPAAQSAAEEARAVPGAIAVTVAGSGRDPWDREQQHHAHYMNPYDFVPFADSAPRLLKIADWGKAELGEETYLSGALSVRLTALQPLHIMGRRNGNAFQFHREAGAPVIPGASLRGLLRSYIEARWNCWVSAYSRNREWYRDAGGNPPGNASNPYVRICGARYVGFNTETEWQDYSPRPGVGWKRQIEAAIPGQVLPPEPDGPTWAGREVDLSTFLFGAVLQYRARSGSVRSEAHHPALRGRLRITSARLHEEQLSEDYWVPDLPRDAFLGGPKPSKSSMFYFEPGEVEFRLAGGRFALAQFIGGRFRGRKFYFHQDWESCVGSYLDPQSPENCWAQGRRQGEVLRRSLESMKPDQTAEFQVHFEGLPRRYLVLLLAAIENPGTRIRHKLGYAKPFGFGSVELMVTGAEVYAIRDEKGIKRLWKQSLAVQTLRDEAASASFDWAADAAAMHAAYSWLRYLLTYDEASLRGLLFTYPGFRTRPRGAPDPPPWVAGFARPNGWGTIALTSRARQAATVDQAKRYWDSNEKYTLDLGLYQRRSSHFGTVCRRAQKPGEALTDIIHAKAK